MDTGNTTSSVGSISGVDNAFVKPAGKFRGVDFFDCDSDTFDKCLKGKRKGSHWNSYLGKSDFTSGVKSWVKSNKQSNFMFRNTSDGSFVYAHKVM